MVSTLGKPLAEIQAIYYLKQGNIILEVKTIANKTDNRYSFASQTLKAGGAITLIGGKQDIKGLILGFSEDYNKIKIEKINATITILSSRIITDKNSFVGIIQKDFSGRKIAEIEEIETKDSKTIAKVKILGFRIKGALFFNGLPLEKGTVLYIVGTNNVLNGIVLDISEREI
jgi:hypothetical protein